MHLPKPSGTPQTRHSNSLFVQKYGTLAQEDTLGHAFSTIRGCMHMTDFATFATSNKGLWAKPTLVTLGVKSGDVSVNIKKGIIEGYLTKYFVPGTQTPVIDPYKDIVEVGAFTKTIQELVRGRDTKGLDYLMPHLWQHNPNEIIGGNKWLVEDKHGVILEVQLAKGVKRADEAL